MTPTNLAAFRLTIAAKRPLLRGEVRKVDTRPAKLAAAISWLGNRYVCAKVNRVGKLAEPLPENFQWVPKLRRAK